MRSYNSPRCSCSCTGKELPAQWRLHLDALAETKTERQPALWQSGIWWPLCEKEMCLNKNSALNTSPSPLRKTSVMAAYDTAAQKGSINSSAPLEDFYLIT